MADIQELMDPLQQKMAKYEKQYTTEEQSSTAEPASLSLKNAASEVDHKPQTNREEYRLITTTHVLTLPTGLTSRCSRLPGIQAGRTHSHLCEFHSQVAWEATEVTEQRRAPPDWREPR